MEQVESSIGELHQKILWLLEEQVDINQESVKMNNTEVRKATITSSSSKKK
jgi:stress response protein YsnF